MNIVLLMEYCAFGLLMEYCADGVFRNNDLQKTTKEINALLSDDGVRDIIDNSVSAEEAQSKIKRFLKGE